jgi:nucleoside-diphosphate-sugar epimerase
LKDGSGIWYKIAVPKDGIYKIDKAFLESCGILTAGLNPNTINIFGNGKQSRANTFVTDVSKILVVALEQASNQQIYNIGTTEIIKIKDLAKKIAKIFIKIKIYLLFQE